MVDYAHLVALRNLAKSTEPNRGAFVLALCILSFSFSLVVFRSAPMVGLIIDNKQAPVAPKFAHDALKHLRDVYLCLGLTTIRTDLSIKRRPFLALNRASLKLLVVNNNKFRVELLKVLTPVRRNKHPRVVIISCFNPTATIDSQ